MRRLQFCSKLAALMTAGALLVACGGDDDDAGDQAGSTQSASVASTASGSSEPFDEPTTPASTVGDTGGTGTAPPAGEPVIGGSLRIRPLGELPSLDPMKSLPTTGGDRLFAIFGGLAVQDYVTAEVRPLMAESIETTDGGTTWEIKIRPGIMFTDGTPYDAAAVVFNWERSADPANASLVGPIVAGMASYEATDDLTVTVVLENPNTQFPISLGSTGLGYIGSPKAITELGADFGNKPVGAGPFTVESWQRDNELVLVRNPDYFDAPRPYLDEVVFRVIPDEGQASETLTAGQLDVSRMYLDTAVNALEGKATVVDLPQLSGFALGMDRAVPPFDDLSFRRAVALAIDRDLISRALDPEASGSNLLFNEGTPLYRADLAFPTQDLAAAQEAFDTYRAAHGGGEVTITFHYNEAQKPAAEAVQGVLSQIQGLKVEIKGYALAEYIPLQRSKQIAFGQNQLISTWGEPVMYDTFYTGGAQNWYNYSNPDVDAALDRARATEDRDEQIAAYQAAGELIIEDLAFVVYDPLHIYYATSDAVKNLAETTIYAGVSRIDSIWIDPR